MPQTPLGVNQQANWALMHRLAAKRQALEGQRRFGACAWIDIECVEFASERPDDAARPSVERIRQSILRLGSMRKVAPLDATGKAKQHHARGRGEPAIELAGSRMKRAAYRQAGLGCTLA